MTLEVVNIELNYTWIQEKDRDTYLLIPVWDFLGYYYSAEEVREEMAQETLYNDYAILSINAINGSNVYRGE